MPTLTATLTLNSTDVTSDILNSGMYNLQIKHENKLINKRIIKK